MNLKRLFYTMMVIFMSVGLSQGSYAASESVSSISVVPAASSNSEVWIKADIIKQTDKNVTLRFRNNRIFDLPKERVEEKKKLTADQKSVEVRLKFGELEKIL